MRLDPSDDFTVRLQQHPSAPHPGVLAVGFISPAAFKPDLDIQQSEEAYGVMPRSGVLCGAKNNGSVFCDGFTKGTVRCVADREAGTITYYVDGVNKGVAWRDVPEGPLHAVVSFWFDAPGVGVELLE